MTQEHLMARSLPPLPLDNWEDAKETLHRYCQISGKVRMELSPFRNHWWHVTLYVITRGLSTGPIPHGPHVGATFDISFGFWPGDQNVREPAFYSYTAPEPEGLSEHSLSPEGAHWLPEGGTALLTYEELRNSSSPTETLLGFMESAYEAGAKSAGWDIVALRTGPPARETAKLRRSD
jgi:hypothetical protein